MERSELYDARTISRSTLLRAACQDRNHGQFLPSLLPLDIVFYGAETSWLAGYVCTFS